MSDHDEPDEEEKEKFVVVRAGDIPPQTPEDMARLQAAMDIPVTPEEERELDDLGPNMCRDASGAIHPEQVREWAVWKTFRRAVAVLEPTPSGQLEAKAKHEIKVGKLVQDLRWAEPFQEFYVGTESGRFYRCHDADHIRLDIDERIPHHLQVVVDDPDGMHVLKAEHVVLVVMVSKVIYL